VFDNVGFYLDSAAVGVTVDNTPPSIAVITSPIAGAYLHQTIIITANAADGSTGVKNVTFWLDAIGTGVLIGTDPTVPYSQAWDTTTTSDGSHNLYIRVFDNAGNYRDSLATNVNVDNTPPTITIEVPAIVAGPATINVTTNENLLSILLNIEFGGVNSSVTMSEITSTVWRGNFEAFVNGTYNLFARALDRANNPGFDTASFLGQITDKFAPNYTASISDPLNLLYSKSGPYPNWATYPESAGLNVNITAQFDEMINLSSPIRGVWLLYSLNDGLNWVTLPMTFDGSLINGKVNISYYTVTLPRLRNGTVVLLDIYAYDDAANAFNLSVKYEELEYLVLGSWIESIGVTALTLAPLVPFTVNITGIIRGENYTVQVLAYFFNPTIGNLQGSFFAVWRGAVANMTRIAYNTYQLSWPYLSYLIHGQVVYISVQVLNTGLTPTAFTWNGAYSLRNTTHTIVYSGYGMSQILETTNITVGQIIDTVPPTMPTDPIPSIAFPSAEVDVEIHINLTDAGLGIKKVTLYYRIGSAGAGAAAGANTIGTAAASNWTAVNALYYGGEYLAIIPKQAAGSHVEFYIEAVDLLGNSYTSTIYSYNVTPASYNLYIFLVALMALGLISTFIIRRRKRAQVTAISGPKRYKLIKQKL